MACLTSLREAHKAAKVVFDLAIEAEFPGRNEWDWFRAVAHVEGENTRRNDDTSDDVALASSKAIKAAWDKYMDSLHAFYRLRDGEHGFLGGRGM